MKSGSDTSLRAANQRLQELRQRIHGPARTAPRPQSAIKIHQEDELPSNESSSIHSGLREDSDHRSKFDVNSRKLKIFKSKPTCLLSTIPTVSLTGTPSEKCSDNTLTGSNFDPFAQSRPISIKEREYNSNKSFRTATSQIDSDAEILQRMAVGRIQRDGVHVDSMQQEPTFGQIVIHRESIRDLVNDGIMAPPPDVNEQMLPLHQNEEQNISLLQKQKSASKSENKESFFEEESSSFDLLRGGLDDEALLSLQSANQQNMTPQLQYEQLMTNQKEEQKMMSPDSCSNFNPVQLNESSSFAVTIQGTYEEVKQCLKQSSPGEGDQRLGSEQRGAINGMEVISEEKQEVDDSSIMAKSKTSRQHFHSSSKKRGSLLESTIKEVHHIEPSFGTFGKRESDRKARRFNQSPGILNVPMGTPAQETPELATKQQHSSRNQGNNINGSQFMARLEMAGGSAQNGFAPSSTDDLYFSPWSSKKNTHELTFSGSIKRRMMLPEDEGHQAPPDIGSESFLSTIRGSNNDLSMTDQSRTLRFLKSENQTSGHSPKRTIEENKQHMSETHTRNTIGSNLSNKHLVSNTLVGSNPLTARQDNESVTSSNDGQMGGGNFAFHSKENNGGLQIPSELNEILHQKHRNPSSHFKGSAYSTDGQYTLLSTQRKVHSRFNSMKRPDSGAVSFAMEQQGQSEKGGSQQIYSGYFVSPSSKSASHMRSETDALIAQFQKIEKEKFQLERKLIEREVEIERVKQELEDLKVHSSADFNTLRNKYDSELAELQRELEEQREEASYKIGELEDAHQRKLQRIESLHQQKMDQLHEELTSQHEEHIQKLKERIGQLNRQIETEKCVQKAKERFEERQVKNETYQFERQNIFERESLRREFEEKLQKEVMASEERLRTEYEYELMQMQKKHEEEIGMITKQTEMERIAAQEQNEYIITEAVHQKTEKFREEYIRRSNQNAREIHDQVACNLKEEAQIQRRELMQQMKNSYEEKMDKMRREIVLLKKENARCQGAMSRRSSRVKLSLPSERGFESRKNSTNEQPILSEDTLSSKLMLPLGSTVKSVLQSVEGDEEGEKENISERRPSAFHIRSEPSMDIETASRGMDDDIPVRLCTTQRTQFSKINELETAMTAGEENPQKTVKKGKKASLKVPEKIKGLGRKLMR